MSNTDRHSLGQKVHQRISVIKTNTIGFERIGILIHVLSWRQQKHQSFFSLLRFFEELFDEIIDDPFLML